MASNFFNIKKGLNAQPVTGSTVSVKGDVAYNSSTDKLELYNGAADPLVNEAKAATLTNKTLSGNTATNLVSGSGTLTLNTTGTITVPNATDTLVGKATTDTLTNKSISTGGTNTVGATTISGVTGTTNLVFSNSPTLVTPALGTPSALVGTNITGTAAGLTAGTVTTNANLTGDITSSGNATTAAATQPNITTFSNASGISTSAGSISAIKSGQGTTVSIVANNTGTASSSSDVTTKTQMFLKNDAGLGLRAQLLSSGATAATTGGVINGGFSGVAAYLFTDTSYPLAIGTNNTAAIKFDTTAVPNTTIQGTLTVGTSGGTRGQVATIGTASLGPFYQLDNTAGTNGKKWNIGDGLTIANGTLEVTNVSDSITALAIKGTTGNIGMGATPNATDRLIVENDQNASTILRLRNGTAGTGAVASMVFESDSASGNVSAYSATNSNTTFADRFVVNTNSDASGLTLATNGASQDMKLYTANAVLAMTINSTQDVTIASGTAGNNRLVILNDANTGGALGNSQVAIRGASSSTKNLWIAMDTSTNKGRFQAESNTATAAPIDINPNGGVVTFGSSITVSSAVTGVSNVKGTTGNTFNVLGSNATATKVISTAEDAGLFIISDTTRGNAAIVYYGGATTLVVTQMVGTEFINSSSPSTSQTGITYADGTGTLTIKNGFTAGGTNAAGANDYKILVLGF